MRNIGTIICLLFVAKWPSLSVVAVQPGQHHLTPATSPNFTSYGEEISVSSAEDKSSSSNDELEERPQKFQWNSPYTSRSTAEPSSHTIQHDHNLVHRGNLHDILGTMHSNERSKHVVVNEVRISPPPGFERHAYPQSSRPDRQIESDQSGGNTARAVQSIPAEMPPIVSHQRASHGNYGNEHAAVEAMQSQQHYQQEQPNYGYLHDAVGRQQQFMQPNVYAGTSQQLNPAADDSEIARQVYEQFQQQMKSQFAEQQMQQEREQQLRRQIEAQKQRMQLREQIQQLQNQHRLQLQNRQWQDQLSQRGTDQSLMQQHG